MKNLLLLFLLGFPYWLTAQDPKIGDCLFHESSGLDYCFAADSSTYDPILGDSYRLLLVINQEDGTEMARHYLKVNLAADFDYDSSQSIWKNFTCLSSREHRPFIYTIQKARHLIRFYQAQS